MLNRNVVELAGRLGKDASYKSFTNGGAIVNLTVATSESWKDKSSGDWKEKTEWHNVVINGEGAVKFAKELKKGERVFIVGKLQTRKYEKNGTDHYVTEIAVSGYRGEISRVDKKLGSDDSNDSQQTESSNSAQDELDDEIPF